MVGSSVCAMVAQRAASKAGAMGWALRLACMAVLLFPNVESFGGISIGYCRSCSRSVVTGWALSRRALSLDMMGVDVSELPGVAPRKTFKRFMQVELFRSPELENLYPILCGIESACRDINRLMRRISTDNLQGLQGNVNIQGEDQKRLDVIANRIMKQALCCTGQVSIVASEEEDEPCLCSAVTDSTFSGEFAAVFDPLDGSGNIDSGLPTGTIFGIYRNPAFGNKDPLNVVQQKGSSLTMAGYCLYSAACHLCITMRSGLHMFTLDDVTGEFYLTRTNIKMPTSGPIYSFNEANSKQWAPEVQNFIGDFRDKRLQVLPGKAPSARYMGALVADAHNIILNGGIFGYPGTLSAPSGKIRLLYEANPMALIFEQAGGKASTGLGRILDLPVSSVHARTPVFFGSVEPVTALESYIARGPALRSAM